jgi:hypothetical protein
MLPRVLLTDLNFDNSHETVNAITSVIDSQRQDTVFSLAINKISELAGFADDRDIPCYEAKGLQKKSSISNVLKAARRLQNIYRQSPFDIVHVHSDDDHLACCMWKLFWKPNVHIIRARLKHKPIPKTGLNKFINNKMIAVNLFPSNELADAYRDTSKGFLKMDNPFVVENYPVLTGDSSMMMKHCYHSLVSLSYFHSRDYGLTDWSHISLSYVVPVYFNQRGPDAVFSLLRRYEKYSAHILDRVHFVVVDDGSPVNYEMQDLNLNITWLKINEDIPWNQPGARNLGAVYAKSDNILLTDLDFEYPEETLGALAASGPCGRNFYKIRIKDPDSGRIGKGHANNFFMSRARFLRHFGYDEEFCGHHGADDFRFVKYHKAQGSRQLNLNSRYFCYRRNSHKKQKDYHSLKRDMSFNTPVDSRKKFEMETYGHEAGHSRTFLNFTWKKIYEKRRDMEIHRIEDRMWKKLWYWRWLFGGR